MHVCHVHRLSTAATRSSRCPSIASAKFATLLVLWFCLGMGYSLVQTPSSRLVRRSPREEDGPARFAAQFALSHACWLITHPVAGWLGAKAGLNVSFVLLAVRATFATIASAGLWSADDPCELEHGQNDLRAEHPHVGEGTKTALMRHTHDFVVDDEHRRRPSCHTARATGLSNERATIVCFHPAKPWRRARCTCAARERQHAIRRTEPRIAMDRRMQGTLVESARRIRKIEETHWVESNRPVGQDKRPA